MKTQPRTGWPASFVLCAAALLPACSGGSTTAPYLYGTLSVSLTDAAHDQVESFRVRVAAIDVVKANTTVLHALAGPLLVDFADLRDTGQLVNSLNASAGSYVRVAIVLDMTGASCLLAGQSTPATIHDDQGLNFNAPVVLDLNIPNYLAVAGADHQLLELDLDLTQSLKVDTSTNTVEFMPVVVVRAAAADQKPVSLIGTLASVDVANSSFVLSVTDQNGDPVSDLTCVSDGATVFQNDGVPSSGATGLTDLSLLPVGTTLEARGTIDPALPNVLVNSVVAGLGTWNGGSDVIDGHVVSRVGIAGADATLTVLGRSSNAAQDSFHYDTLFDVTTTFAGTQVVRQGSATDFDTDSLDIGQHVRIFGTLTGTDMDSATGLAQALPTVIHGTATAAPAAGQLTLSLSSVGLRDAGLYDFTDPTTFVTDVGTLADALAIDVGTNVVERGFVAPVGSVGVNFQAVEVENADTSPLLLLVRNRLGTGFALTLTPTAGQVDVTVTGPPAAGEAAVLDQGFAGSSNLPGSPTPDIKPVGSVGLYLLLDMTAGTSTLYTHFPSFSGAINAAVGLGAGVRHVAAIGSFEPVTGTLRTKLVSVLVQ